MKLTTPYAASSHRVITIQPHSSTTVTLIIHCLNEFSFNTGPMNGKEAYTETCPEVYWGVATQGG